MSEKNPVTLCAQLKVSFNSLLESFGRGSRSQQVEVNFNERSPVCSVPRFKSNWLQWPVERSSSTFRIYVVEPREYKPQEHGEIFNAALTSLISAPSVPVDPFTKDIINVAAEHFDLVTFPEAFLPQEDLLSVLRQVSELAEISSLGCVHVGLRPSPGTDQHLFTADELRNFVKSLLYIPRICKGDLEPFASWLQSQPDDCQFNVGCLFTIDAHQSLRICLHPKLVRSRFEASPLHDKHMTEADLLTLVTLQPENKALLSITLQPLICSDALSLDTDRPNNRPLEAVNTDADCFGKMPPDHIDIISIATCTPQREQGGSDNRHRRWHQQFRNSFVNAASNPAMARHYFSTFVFSNFGALPEYTEGGLSGAFMPIQLPFPYSEFPKFLTIHAWGRPKEPPGADNTWYQPYDSNHNKRGWSSLGYVAAIDPFKKDSHAFAHMLGFTIARLLRHSSSWRPTDGLTDFQLRKATCNETGKMVFRKEV
jgi:hypothetical protein